MVKLCTLMIIIVCVVCSNLFTADSATQFLTSLRSKSLDPKKPVTKKSVSSTTASRVVRKTKLSDPRNSFLLALQKDKQKSLSAQTENEEAKKKKEALAVQQLHFIEQYYGNPDYKSAMKILNDSTLQRQYQQDLDQMQIYFFEYTQKVLSSFHASPKLVKNNDEQKDKTVTSFLNSLKNSRPATTVKNTDPLNTDVKSALKFGDSSSTVSFLNSLKGKG